jgi:hypothetical protein
MPFSTEKIIKKSMIPSTLMAIGLQDKHWIRQGKFHWSIYYNWTPKKITRSF